jgi:hypothetical protein
MVFEPLAVSCSDSLAQDFWSTEKERVYLVGVNVKSEQKSKYSYTIEESLEELGRLADTAGLKVGIYKSWSLRPGRAIPRGGYLHRGWSFVR